MNRIFAFLLILFLSPILIFISIIIFLDDGMPIVFTQKRLGKNEKEFTLYKFRTMHFDTSIANHKHNDGEYLLRTGKIIRYTSLDELLNIFNVLFGHINFIGPRPTRTDEYELIRLKKVNKIFEIKPGITGLAQVRGRDKLTLEKRVKYDVLYKKHRSLFLDFLILILTIFKLFNYNDVKNKIKG